MCDVCASRVPLGGRRSKAEAIGKPTGWPLKSRLIEARVAIALCTIHYEAGESPLLIEQHLCLAFLGQKVYWSCTMAPGGGLVKADIYDSMCIILPVAALATSM